MVRTWHFCCSALGLISLGDMRVAINVCVCIYIFFPPNSWLVASMDVEPSFMEDCLYSEAVVCVICQHLCFGEVF